MEPFYFGLPGKRLYGIFHEPQGGSHRDCGIVLCYPLGREYTNSHRAFRQLATSLAHHGFPVLRFDFCGCGDSEGEDHEGSVSQWLADIGTAIAEITSRCKPSKICLVGLRFGATLAMIYGAQNVGMEVMVLWDPIARGSTYMTELGSLYAEFLSSRATASEGSGVAERRNGILGFPPADSFFRDLGGIDLSTTAQAPARAVLLIESVRDSRRESLKKHLGSLAPQFDYRHLPGVDFRTGRVNKVVFAGRILQTAVSWISTTCP